MISMFVRHLLLLFFCPGPAFLSFSKLFGYSGLSREGHGTQNAKNTLKVNWGQPLLEMILKSLGVRALGHQNNFVDVFSMGPLVDI